MKKFLVTIIFSAICLQACDSLALQTAQEADALFDDYKLTEAAAIYEALLARDPGDYGLLWRLARCYARIGYLADENKKRNGDLRRAADYARRAIEARPDGFEGHNFLAEALGNLASSVGVQEKVRFAREIKSEAEKAIELEPSYYMSYLILGMWHRKVEESSPLERFFADLFFGGVPEASMEEAEANLRRAAELAPVFGKVHYELALVYYALGKKALAAEELRKAVKCDIFNVKDAGIREKAARLLKRI